LTRLDDVLTGSVGTLKEETSGEQVTIAGTVQRVHRHRTKKGNDMAFVTLEDAQGSCDVVVFPGVWRETKQLWQPEQIIVVNGRVDASRRDEPSLICSWVKRPEEVTTASMPSGGERHGPRAEATALHDGAATGVPTRPERRSQPVEERSGAVEPAAPTPQTVTVTLRRTEEQSRDEERLRKVHDLLSSYGGHDRFVIRLTDGSNGGFELRFPNKATDYCPELRRELYALVGEDAVQVEQQGA
jgi:DNA polymerase-3 subunit alpha